MATLTVYTEMIFQAKIVPGMYMFNNNVLFLKNSEFQSQKCSVLIMVNILLQIFQHNTRL